MNAVLRAVETPQDAGLEAGAMQQASKDTGSRMFDGSRNMLHRGV